MRKTTSSSSGLKWKAPNVTESQQTAAQEAEKQEQESPVVAKQPAATASKSADVAKATSEQHPLTLPSPTRGEGIEPNASAEPIASETALVKSETIAPTTTAPKTIAADKPTTQVAKAANVNAANVTTANGNTAKIKTAASPLRRIATHDDSSVQVIQTAVTEPKIDPFGDDEKPAAKTPAKRDGTPAKRAAQAGVQPGRENTANDPFPTDPPLGQPPAEPPGRFGPLEEELTQAPRRGPEPCPSPNDLKPLNQISNKIDAEPGEFPAECGLGDERYNPRQWSMTTYTWQATGLCHKPLYFEDAQLERYGNSCSPFLQPVISGAHFFLTVPILPYKMGLESPFECVYPLGTYRPGSCAPFYVGPVPLSARGALYETGTVLGLVFLIP